MTYVILSESAYDSPTPPVCAHDTLDAAIECWTQLGSRKFQEIWNVDETGAEIVWPKPAT